MITDVQRLAAKRGSDRDDERLFGRPLTRCPACGSRDLELLVERETEEVHFSCGTCERCWYVDLGFARPIAPASCLGSTQRGNERRASRAHEVRGPN